MDDGDCSKGKIDPIEFLKNTIKSKFGITMGGEKDWSSENLRKIYNGLMNIDKFLGGKVKSLVDGAEFVFGGDPSSRDYYGETGGMKITFYVKANLVIPFQNLYHEFGHLLDNAVGDAISDQIDARAHYTSSGKYLFGGGEGALDPKLLLNNYRVPDPDWSGDIRAIQALAGDQKKSTEQWADMFANAVSGNIKLDDPSGRAVYAHVRGYLYPYVGLPQP
jgi:hypothetical protein